MNGKDNIKKYLIDNFKGKSILFIENDMDLYHTVGKFRDLLTECKISYSTQLRVSKIPTEMLIGLIRWHDVIVWESQYTSKKTDDIINLLLSKETDTGREKILLECYLYEPHWWYKPKTNKRVMLFTKDELYELKTDEKPIWSKDDNEL